MASIRILPKNLANQIAAGEVVERPASVVKELVENALDAGADNIIIHLQRAGKEVIEVIDNGHGMDEADAALSLQRFATSKIKTEQDLFNIHSFGFRGEALPSIASVSLVRLQTRPTTQEHGTEIRLKGGENAVISEIGMNPGTHVRVESLFFNIPARLKYLKSDSTELSHIVEYVTTIALVYPGVSFTLTQNGKKVFQLDKKVSVLERLQDVFDPHIAEELLPVQHSNTTLNLSGFISHPRYSKNTNKYSFLFINKRPVKNNAIYKAIRESYGHLIERDAFPFFMLDLQLDPTKVDVNVHPRKLEVRFEDSQGIFHFFKTALDQALTQAFLSTASNNTSQTNPEKSLPSSLLRPATGGFPRSPYAFRPSVPSQQSSLATEAITETKEASSYSLKPIASYFQKILGQIHNCYILFETEKGFGVADQHAAHEIILYHRIETGTREKAANQQQLLTPITIDLSIAQLNTWEKSGDIFKSLGFETQLVGKNGIALTALPAALMKADPSQLVLDLLDECEEYSQQSIEEKQHRLYATMACRAAVKFGDPLSLEECYNLLHELEQLHAGYSCPHGRPVIKEFNLQEMLKWFKR